jgi:SAM-dependent methyltransferase
MNRHAHWEQVYTAKSDAELSWHQEEPGTSLRLILEASPERGSVVDIGGGASVLAGRLYDEGFRRVAVLDISAAALERARQRMPEHRERIDWFVGDVTAMDDLGRFDVWHDRAVFHFLTDADDRRSYVWLLSRTIHAGGHAIIAAFGPEGPPKCSGLDVCRYGPETLAAELGPGFEPVKDLIETHRTPWGKPQQFYYGVFKRV